MSTQHEQKTHSRPKQKYKRMEKAENNTFHSKVTLCCVCIKLPHKSKADSAQSAFLCDSSISNRFGWFRSSIFRSHTIARSFISFSIFHVSTAFRKYFMNTTRGKKMHEKEHIYSKRNTINK